VAFGDSLSDGGNDPSAPCTGGVAWPRQTWVQQLANYLGDTTFRPSRAGGSNYAWAGAETDDVRRQVDWYLSRATPATGALLVTIGGGGNDLVNKATSIASASRFRRTGWTDDHGSQLDAVATVAAKNLAAQIRRLATAGATDFLWVNRPAVGMIPLAQNTGDARIINALNAASRVFNTQMDSSIAAIRRDLPGVNIMTLDLYSVLEHVMSAPSACRFTNVTGSATAAGRTSSPDGYIFWDDMHPTAHMHNVIAQAALSQLRITPGRLP
jgi:outer membrane lipase/esterase